MDRAADLSTCEITVARLKLAGDLLFTPQVHGTNFYCHIESPSRGTFYRVGYAEYLFLSMFDGKVSVAQALTHSARTLGAGALTRAQGVKVATWLLENGLAEFMDAQGSTASTAPYTAAARNRWAFNPFWWKVSAGSPDRLLSVLVASLGWMLAPWATAIGLIIIALGGVVLATHWDLFVVSTAGVLLPSNWGQLALAWLALKIVHEMAHALACKYYRGEVRDTGVIFILLAPLAYVDVTSCWRFPSKWQRIHVAVAGMYAELVVASIAAMFWVYADGLTARHFLHNVILMASISTLLFNANPLMRFDGYYLLADLVEIPNLGTEADRMFRGWCSRIFYGTPPASMQLAGMRRWIIGLYGGAIAVWRCVTCVSLAAAASVLLNGLGIFLAITALGLWFGKPTWNVLAGLWCRFHESRSSFYRATGLGMATLVTAILLLTSVPWPGSVTAPFVVDYADLAVLRCRSDGFVDRIHVVDGERVSKGQLLVELRNDVLQSELHELQAEMLAAQLKHRAAIERQDSGAVQVAWKDCQAVAQRLEESEKRVLALQIRSPNDGVVIARNLDQQIGAFLEEGAEVLSVGDPLRKELVVSAGQQDVETIAPYVGLSTRFRIGGRAGMGSFERLAPRASFDLTHPALSASVGGPLAVTDDEDSYRSGVRLAEPRFRGVITLTADQSSVLGVGARGYAVFGLRDICMGEFIWIRFTHWLRALIPAADRPT